MSPGFFHNGAFVRMEDAIRFHLNVIAGARTYSAVAAGLPPDLTRHVGPPVPVTRLDARMRHPTPLDPRSLADLVAFVRDGLHDPCVTADNLCTFVPASVPSGRPVLQFEACR